MMDFPRIRVELESMKHQMVVAIAAHMTELKAATEEAVRDAVDSFDVVAYVKREAARLIENQLREFIARKIDEAIHDAWTKNGDLNEYMRKAAAKEIEHRFAEAVAWKDCAR